MNTSSQQECESLVSSGKLKCLLWETRAVHSVNNTLSLSLVQFNNQLMVSTPGHSLPFHFIGRVC